MIVLDSMYLRKPNEAVLELNSQVVKQLCPHLTHDSNCGVLHSICFHSYLLLPYLYFVFGRNKLSCDNIDICYSVKLKMLFNRFSWIQQIDCLSRIPRSYQDRQVNTQVKKNLKFSLKLKAYIYY